MGHILHVDLPELTEAIRETPPVPAGFYERAAAQFRLGAEGYHERAYYWVPTEAKAVWCTWTAIGHPEHPLASLSHDREDRIWCS